MLTKNIWSIQLIIFLDVNVILAVTSRHQFTQSGLRPTLITQVTRTTNLGTWGTAWSRTSDDCTSSTSSVV